MIYEYEIAIICDLSDVSYVCLFALQITVIRLLMNQLNVLVVFECITFVLHSNSHSLVGSAPRQNLANHPRVTLASCESYAGVASLHCTGSPF